MNANTTTWIRRVAAGAVLATGCTLVALGAASASHAETSTSTSPSYAPAPAQTVPQYRYNDLPWYLSSFHHRHALQQQSNY